MNFKPIGHIETPYIDKAPYQPIKEDKGEFKIVLNKEFQDGLEGLEKFSYIFVIYFLDQVSDTQKSLKITPPWLNEEGKVGIFASRAPNRPNPIGLSIVKLKKIEENIIHTSGLDVFNHTPLLDIKPYIKDLDQKMNSNYGWLKLDGQEDRDHLLKHIKGLPH